MTDKHRHRVRAVPHGTAPNWLLMTLGACAAVFAIWVGALV